MPQDINPDLLARLEKYKLYKDVFDRQFKERKKAQRSAAKIRSREPAIAIGVNGEMNVISPGTLRNLRQKELQDVFGTQQSSLLSKKLKQDRATGSAKAIETGKAKAEQQKLLGEIAAQKQAAESVSLSGTPKAKSSMKVGKAKIRWSPAFDQQGKLTGFQQTVDGTNKAFLPYNPYEKPISRSAAYESAFDIESTPGKPRINMHAQTVEGPRRFRVKAGRKVEFGGKTYKGGQYVPTQAGLIDNIIGRASQGVPLLPSERSFLEENYPADFLNKMSQKRLQVGTPNPESLANLPRNFKHQWMMEDEQIQKEARQRAFELDKQAKLKDYHAAQNAKQNARRAQAVLSSGFKDPTIETNYAKLSAPVADEIAQVTQKKAISTRTMERLMKSHTVAAGVAAGGLGLMYAFNRKRAEEQVGR